VGEEQKESGLIMTADYYHKTSPFLQAVNEHLEEVIKETRKEVYMMDRSNGELITETNGNPVRLIRRQASMPAFTDKQQYIKLFTQGLPLLMELSAPGLKVFMWVLGHIKPKQDKVELNPGRVAAELNYVVTKPVHDGIKDLINQRIIARAYTGNRNVPAYWINPTVFYNGNRRHLFNKNPKNE